MELTISQMQDLEQAIDMLSSHKFPSPTSGYRIAIWKRKIKTVMDAYGEQEQKLIEEYDGQINEGFVQFFDKEGNPDSDRLKQFVQARESLRKEVEELELSPLPVSEFTGLETNIFLLIPEALITED